MPVDPSISLSGTLTKSPPTFGQQNPLELIGQFANVQNAINQNRLFQQTFAARQRAGQILAASPDLETGIKNLYSDPLVAPFAGETVNLIRSGQQTLVATQGEQQKQAQDGLSAALKALPAILDNPTESTWNGVMNAQMRALSPSARAAVAPALESYKAALLDGLPADQTARQKEIQKRVAAYSLGAGITPETIKGVLGTPETLDVGAALQPVVRAPVQAGGGVSAAGQAIGKSLAPQIVHGTGAEGQDITTVLGGQGGNALAPAGQSLGNPLGVGPSTAAQPTSRGSAAGLTGPTLQQAGALKGQGEAAGQIAEDMKNVARNLPSSLKRIDMLTDSMKDFQSGGGANVRGSLGKLMQGLKNAGMNISDATIDKVANSSLPAGQLFDSEIKPLLVRQLTADAHGQGQVRRPEVDAYLELLDKTTDPNVILKVLNQVKYGMQLDYDMTKKWPQFRQLIAKGDSSVKGLDAGDFQYWYNENVKPSELPTGTPGGLNVGPTGPEGIKGTRGGEGAKGRMRYDPSRPKGQRLIPVE